MSIHKIPVFYYIVIIKPLIVMEKTCPVCGDRIIGRVDKKFCSDQCRNAFNNKQNSDQTNYVRKVNNILRKNRRILAQLNPNGKMVVTKGQLQVEGFNFNYYTDIYTTKAGKQYYFCYEQGYLAVENEHYALVVKKEQMQ